jgi:glycosyltransferase involved in cell wall biosynthesis
MQDDPLPVVSVVMPTYNQAHFLRSAVRSVLDQDYSRWELLIINNFSDDNTLEIIEGFPDPRIRCENFRNEGIIAASRNRGIRLSRGEFVAFLDSDDLWYPAKLSTCLRAMGGGTDAVYHGMRIMEDGIPAGQLVPSPPEKDLHRALLFQGKPPIATSSVIIRKQCLTEVGGFCEDREIVSAEDYDLWLRLSKHGTRFLPLREILGEYRVHRGNASQNIRRQSAAEVEILAREFTRVSDGSFSMLIRRRRRMALAYLRASRRFQMAGDMRNAALYVVKALRELV